MGKPTGFMEFERKSTPYREPNERLKNWNEFYKPLSDKELQEQGARCMDCGIPFCQTGSEFNNKSAGCPVYNLIPEWNDRVYRGDWKTAWQRLRATNNFPEFTGRICPAPCESACVLGINDDPVTIRAIERAIADRAFAEGWERPYAPDRRSGLHVAVVGSGPAGLAAADQLNRAGHRVTGATIKTFCYAEVDGPSNTCCGLEGISDARSVAGRVGFPHFVYDAEEAFAEDVIGNFVSEYAAGRTPIPCVRCNERVKFRDLMGTAAEAVQAVPLLPHALDPDRWLFWLGIIFILLVYFFPKGIAGTIAAKGARA